MTVIASGYELQSNDLYETPWNVTEALLKHLPVSGLSIWEPCAGNHKIADMLKLHGAHVTTSDITTYKREHSYVVDFTATDTTSVPLMHSISEHVDAIITNPPYGKQGRLAVTFCRLALKRCNGWIAMLMTNGFDSGSTRTDLFRDNPRFHTKLVLLDRPAWFEDGGGTTDYSWFIWSPHNNENAKIVYERLTPLR